MVVYQTLTNRLGYWKAEELHKFAYLLLSAFLVRLSPFTLCVKSLKKT